MKRHRDDGAALALLAFLLAAAAGCDLWAMLLVAVVVWLLAS